MLPDTQQSTSQRTSATNQRNAQTARGGAFFQALDMLGILLRRWYLFVLSVGLAIFCAKVYLLYTPAVYTRQASILIKDHQNSHSQVNQALARFGFYNSIDVNNELFALRSPDLAAEVVRRLHLEMNYMAQGRFHEEPIYGNKLPVELEVLGMKPVETCEFDFHLDPAGYVVLSSLSRNGAEFKGAYRGHVGSVIRTPIGDVSVQRSQSYTPQDIKLRVFRTGFQTAVNSVMGRLAVQSVGEWSTIISLVYNDIDPQRAEDVLTTLIEIYNENWIKDNNRVAQSTSEFIGDRLSIIERELSGVEDDISDYRSAHLLPTGATDLSSAYMGQALSTREQARDLNTQINLVRSVRKYITTEANYFELIPNGAGLGGGISSKIERFNEMILRRNTLVNGSSDKNPRVVELTGEMEIMRNALVATIDDYIGVLNIQLGNTRDRRGEATSVIASAPQQHKHMLGMERQQKVKEQLYLYLLQKREENELTQAFTAYNSRVITPASGSNAPTSPVESYIYSIAMLVGLAIPAVILVLIDLFNNQVRGRKDLEGLHVPFVGEIPLAIHKRTRWERIKKNAIGIWHWIRPPKHIKEVKDLHMVIKHHSRNIINEAFRVVRTNLEFMSAHGGRNKVLMTTSFLPNSGKTFLVSNLVTSFAQKKKRIIAIDLDMRKASLSAMVDKPNVGVADYLSGNVEDFHDIICPVEGQDNLFVIPVGTIPPNPTELLFEETLPRMLAQLREEYDYIFLDCPPVEIVADATIVAKHADLTIFCIRADGFDRSWLPEVDRYYTENQLPKMCIVLNGTRSSFSYYGYGYHRYGYGRYGYSYGYGYGRRNHSGKSYAYDSYHEED